MVQKDENREIILADMHGDGVHFNRALVKRQKQLSKEMSESKKSEAKKYKA